MDPHALLVLALLVWGAGYLAACRFWPWARCPKCKGTGRRNQPASRGRAWRTCPRCKGSARRLRWGRRLSNHFRGARTASRTPKGTR